MDIQDDRGSRKKAWKAFQANYDDVFALSDRLCSYCLSDQMVQAMLTMTEYLKWPTRWVAAAGDIDPEQIQLFASQMEYRLMNGCCDDQLPIQWRYTADGTLQQSMNGGGTWTDAPLYDPRVYSSTFPPVSGEDGDDKKCVAASGMVALIKEQIGDQLTDDMTRYTLGQLITDWVTTMLQRSNPFDAIITVITNQIFALVIAVLRPALTDDVYEQLKCIFYCHIADDASFDTVGWQAVRADITSKIGGIAGLFFEHLVYLLGEKGLTNLGRAGGATEGTCDCSCGDCPSYNFLSSNGGWTAFDGFGHGVDGTWVSGSGWQDRYDPIGGIENNRLAIISPEIHGCTGDRTIFVHLSYTTSFPPDFAINSFSIDNTSGGHYNTAVSQTDAPNGDKILTTTLSFGDPEQIIIKASAQAADWFVWKVEVS